MVFCAASAIASPPMPSPASVAVTFKPNNASAATKAITTSTIRVSRCTTIRIDSPYRPRTRGRNSPRICVALQAQKLGTHFRCALIAQVPIFLQCPVDDRFQIEWEVRIEAYSSDRSAVQDGIEESSSSLAS
jgi:hypothetical protein